MEIKKAYFLGGSKEEKAENTPHTHPPWFLGCGGLACGTAEDVEWGRGSENRLYKLLTRKRHHGLGECKGAKEDTLRTSSLNRTAIMGCAPSIHISDSRVVYHSNKEPEDSNSSQQQQGNPVPGLFIKSSNTSGYKLRTNPSKKDKRDNMEVETQISRSSVKVIGAESQATENEGWDGKRFLWDHISGG